LKIFLAREKFWKLFGIATASPEKFSGKSFENILEILFPGQKIFNENILSGASW
jgi:hypothetical protein